VDVRSSVEFLGGRNNEADEGDRALPECQVATRALAVT
jgi:hypothetical protein